MHIAARRDNSAIAETLLNHHARTDIKASHLQIVLHRAGILVLTLLIGRGLVHSQLNNYEYSKMHQCIQYYYFEFACLLIDSVVDINTTNWEGKTLVQTAVEKGLSRVVEKLVEKGATRPSRTRADRASMILGAILLARNTFGSSMLRIFNLQTVFSCYWVSFSLTGVG